MDIFTTKISDAIAQGFLKEGAFTCQENGKLKRVGAFSKKVISIASSAVCEKFFHIDNLKLSKMISEHKAQSPAEEEILKANISYLSKVGILSSEMSQDQLRANIKKAQPTTPALPPPPQRARRAFSISEKSVKGFLQYP